jgi:DNA-binding NtrC family response regulator
VFPLNIRIIAATNRELERQTAKGEFRQDLYYRPNVARVYLLALRDRKDDIPTLLDHYVRTCSARTGRGVEGISDEAMELSTRYAFRERN